MAARAARGWRGGPRALWLMAFMASLTAVALVAIAVRARVHHASAPSDRGDPAIVGQPRDELLGYLPAECAAYRTYVDVAAVVSTLHLSDVLMSEHVPGPWKSIFEIFESAHLRPGKEIRELAVCAQQVPHDEDEGAKIYVAIGGLLGGREALHTYRTVVQELTHAKDAEVLEKESAGVPYLVSSYTPGRKWIAMPAPDVLVFFTDSTAQVAALAKPHDVDRARWRLGRGVLASFAWSDASDDDSPTGDATAGTLSLGPADTSGDEVVVLDAKGPVRASAALERSVVASIPGRLGDAFASSPFAPLADPFRRMTLDLRRSTLHVKLEVPVAKLVEAGHIAARDRHAVRELWENLRRVAASTKQ